jgi:hypothetical protein
MDNYRNPPATKIGHVYLRYPTCIEALVFIVTYWDLKTDFCMNSYSMFYVGYMFAMRPSF